MTLARTDVTSTPGRQRTPYFAGTVARPVLQSTFMNDFIIRPSLANFPTLGIDPEYTQGLAEGKGPTWDSSGASYGATVYSRAKPAKPIVSLSNFLIELRELPQLIRTMRQAFEIAKDIPFDLPARLRDKKKVKDLLSAHVGVEFGLLPTIRDLAGMLKSVDEFQNFLDRYSSYDGKAKSVKRRVTVYEKHDSISSSNPINFTTSKARENISQTLVQSDGAQSYYYAEWGDVVWGVAEFSVALKAPSSVKEERDLYRRYLGLTLSPEVIWNAVPWTWLLDWAGNIGDVYSNVSESAADSTVIRSGWVMRHKYLHANCSLWTGTKSGTFSTRKEAGSNAGSESTLWHETKSRVRADPYGVRILQPDLSARQAAVLGSLGLMKLIKA